MSASKVIKQLMAETGTTVRELAAGMGCTPHSFSNRLCRGTFTYTDYLKIVSLMGCTVQTVTSTGKAFQNDYEPDAPEEQAKIKKSPRCTYIYLAWNVRLRYQQGDFRLI